MLVLYYIKITLMPSKQPVTFLLQRWDTFWPSLCRKPVLVRLG